MTSKTPHIFEWYQSDSSSEIVFRKNKDIKEHIIAFKINQIPDFDVSKDEGNQEKYIESLLRQKTFIDTINSLFLSNKNFSKSVFELRILNNPQTKLINCYIILKIIIDHSFFVELGELKNSFLQILPEDYVFSEIEDVEIKKLLSLDNKEVVEIRKNANLISVGSNNYITENVKILKYNIPLEQVSKARFHIPVSNYLQLKAYNSVSLYKAIQDLDEEVQIRISLNLTSVFEIEKNIAIQFSNSLKSTYNHLASYEINSYESSFIKYISNKQLYSTKIQVASLNEKVATHIANSFCSQIAYGEFSTQTNLAVISLKNENKEIVKSDWENCNHYHFSSFKINYEEDDIDNNLQAFMCRLPYLCDGSEAMAVFRLPVSNLGGLPGLIAKPVKPFYQPNPQQATKKKRINLGRIITSNASSEKINNGLEYSLPIEDLTKHGLIVGSTGSGKTNTTLNFVKELTENGIPFLLIEPVKSEYHEELSAYFKSKNIELNRFNFKRPFNDDGRLNKEFFRFNPLIPIAGINIAQHISYIKGCFSAAFPMHGIMPMILEDCLYELYGNACKLGKSGKDFFNVIKSPKYFYDKKVDIFSENEKILADRLDIKELDNIIDKHLQDEKLYPDKRTKQEFGGYLQRRIQRLTKGVLGFTLSPKQWLDSQRSIVNNNIATLLEKPTIIELEALADNEEKALMMAFILTMIFEHRQVLPSIKSIKEKQGVKFELSENIHISIIEEAHRLLSSSGSTPNGSEIVTQDSKSKSISLFIDMLAEIRAKGEGIFIVEQIPTKLVSDVIKNTNLKIMHRITSKDDRHYLGEAMNMNEKQKNYVTNLKQGEAIIFEEQLDNPVFVKINEFKR